MTNRIDTGVQFTVAVTAEEMAAWPPSRVKMLFKGMATIQRALGQRLGPTPAALQREVVDEIHRFLAARCLVEHDQVTSSQTLYAVYADWSGTPPTLTPTRFGAALTKLGFERRKLGHDRRWHWLGIGIPTP